MILKKLGWAWYGLAGVVKLAVCYFRDRDRFVDLTRLEPRDVERIDVSTTIKSAIGSGVKFVVASLPFNNYTDLGKPASSNVENAWVMSHMVGHFVPYIRQYVYAQQEIADALFDLHGSEYRLPDDHVLRPANPSDWVPTDEFFAWLYDKVSQGQRLDERPYLFLSVQWYHAQRALLVAEKKGFKVLVSYFSFFNKKFDPEGGQWWCRGKRRYIVWDFLSRLIYLGQGKI